MYMYTACLKLFLCKTYFPNEMFPVVIHVALVQTLDISYDVFFYSACTVPV